MVKPQRDILPKDHRASSFISLLLFVRSFPLPFFSSSFSPLSFFSTFYLLFVHGFSSYLLRTFRRHAPAVPIFLISPVIFLNALTNCIGRGLAKLTRRCTQLRGNRPFPIFLRFPSFWSNIGPLLFPLNDRWFKRGDSRGSVERSIYSYYRSTWTTRGKEGRNCSKNLDFWL